MTVDVQEGLAAEHVALSLRVLHRELVVANTRLARKWTIQDAMIAHVLGAVYDLLKDTQAPRDCALRANVVGDADYTLPLLKHAMLRNEVGRG